MTEFTFYPHSVVWEITFACNMRCIHCGTSAGKKRPDELTDDEALKLCDELAALGTKWLTISGGEPLLRPDWQQIARRAKADGIEIGIISNGYALDEDAADAIAGIGFTNVGLSFDGIEKTHNYIRQRDDSFRRVTNAMDFLHKRGVKFCAVSQISNLNIGEMDQMRRILIEHHANAWQVQLTTTTGRMKGLADMILSLDNYPRLIDKLLELRALDGLKVNVGENIGYYGCKGTELWDELPYLGCYAGTRILGVESNGTIKGCLSMPEDFVEGNIRERSLTEIWNDPNGFAYNRRFTRESADGPCRDCHYLPMCRGGCTTTSYSQTGCIANNPYCIYQMELRQGIKPPPDPEAIAEVLARFDGPPARQTGTE